MIYIFLRYIREWISHMTTLGRKRDRQPKRSSNYMKNTITDTDNPISILSNYMKKMLGYKSTGKRNWDKKEKKNVTKFFIVEPMYKHWLDMNTKIGSDKWVREQFFKFDIFKDIPLGSDYKFTKARNVLRKRCVAHQIRKHGQQCRITSFLSRFAYKS